MLQYGAIGKVLKRLNYVELNLNTTQVDRKNSNQSDLDQITFQKKRRATDFSYQVNTWRRTRDVSLDQSPVYIPEKKGWPVISIVIDDKNLYDPQLGIIANSGQKGREWEREAQVFIFQNKKTVFSSGVGLRIHGGLRRVVKPYNSFRLYFKDVYGARSMPGDLFFQGKQDPVTTLVIHTTDWPPGQPMNNPLAYDIANRVGSLAPRIRLVEMVLNHKSLGMAYVTEHLSRKQWRSRLGHNDFAFYKFRGTISKKDEKMYIELFWKYTDSKERLEMERVGRQIDLDNLSRQIFVWAFCGTTDYCQGVGVYDYRSPGAKLFWLTWDLDHSFFDYYAKRHKLKRKNWLQAAFAMFQAKGRISCGRAELFARLVRESAAYRDFCINLITGLLNHRLTRQFLLSRVAYYRTMLENFNDPHPQYIAMLQEFMEQRPGFIRKDIVQFFNLRGVHRVRLSAPVGKEFLIDGYPVTGSYEGNYFSGYPCTIQVQAGSKKMFSHWLVDGKKWETDQLRLTVEKNMKIRAVYIQDTTRQ